MVEEIEYGVTPALLSLGSGTPGHPVQDALLEKGTISCVLGFSHFPVLAWHTQSHRSVFYLCLVPRTQNSTFYRAW